MIERFELVEAFWVIKSRFINNSNRTNRSAIDAKIIRVITNQPIAQREVDVLITSMIWH